MGVLVGVSVGVLVGVLVGTVVGLLWNPLRPPSLFHCPLQEFRRKW